MRADARSISHAGWAVLGGLDVDFSAASAMARVANRLIATLAPR